MANTLVDGTRLAQALQRTKAYIDKKTSVSSGGGTCNALPWLHLELGSNFENMVDSIAPGGSYTMEAGELLTGIPGGSQLRDYCGIHLYDSDAFGWYFPFSYFPDDNTDVLTAPVTLYGRTIYLDVYGNVINIVDCNRAKATDLNNLTSRVGVLENTPEPFSFTLDADTAGIKLANVTAKKVTSFDISLTGAVTGKLGIALDAIGKIQNAAAGTPAAVPAENPMNHWPRFTLLFEGGVCGFRFRCTGLNVKTGEILFAGRVNDVLSYADYIAIIPLASSNKIAHFELQS